MDDYQEWAFQPFEFTNDPTPYPEMDLAIGYDNALLQPFATGDPTSWSPEPAGSANQHRTPHKTIYNQHVDWDALLAEIDSVEAMRAQPAHQNPYLTARGQTMDANLWLEPARLSTSAVIPSWYGHANQPTALGSYVKASCSIEQSDGRR